MWMFVGFLVAVGGLISHIKRQSERASLSDSDLWFIDEQKRMRNKGRKDKHQGNQGSDDSFITRANNNSMNDFSLMCNDTSYAFSACNDTSCAF